jgi:AcrR family transcriptional regulator
VTDKKENILTTALELFANEGYNAVSTSKIAKKAQVSEGLIFKHFINKKGLLDALMADAEKKVYEVLSPIIFENNPKKVIQKVIELPFTIKETEYGFWKLQFKLKWEQEYYNPEKMKPLIDKLSIAFEALGYEEPLLEARFLEQIMDTISIGILREGLANQMPFKSFLIDKYNLNTNS